MIIKRYHLLFGIILILSVTISCTSSARLYPANDAATPLGVLKAEYQNYGTGHGTITVTLPDGEVLEGEYSTADNSSYQFGSVYASVYGTGGSAYGTASGGSVGISGSSPGIASFFGSKGTSMNCEYFVNNITGSGGGACKDSKGRLWKLHF
jgi:hypothetical protein